MVGNCHKTISNFFLMCIMRCVPSLKLKMTPNGNLKHFVIFVKFCVLRNLESRLFITEKSINILLFKIKIKNITCKVVYSSIWTK